MKIQPTIEKTLVFRRIYKYLSLCIPKQYLTGVDLVIREGSRHRSLNVLILRRYFCKILIHKHAYTYTTDAK